MTERPIIFSGESVRAILEGRKTQTRRVVKYQGDMEFDPADPHFGPYWLSYADGENAKVRCPYGVPGDRLWVRETYRHYGNGFTAGGPVLAHVQYRADNACLDRGTWPNFASAPEQTWWNTGVKPWTSPLFMPRWASRITLELTDVRVQRVQEITRKDAMAEGCEGMAGDGDKNCILPEDQFQELWDSLNAKRGFAWADDPFVWSLTFRVSDGPRRTCGEHRPK